MTPPILIGHEYILRFYGKLQRRRRMPHFVVYRPITVEYPGLWVARVWVMLPDPKPTRMVMSHDTLDELRALKPHHLAVLKRLREDAPEIEEIWL